MKWCEEYEYRDGNLFAKTSINGKYPVGRKVGYVDVRGYVRTKLGSKMTFAHRNLCTKGVRLNTCIYRKARKINKAPLGAFSFSRQFAELQ